MVVRKPLSNTCCASFFLCEPSVKMLVLVWPAKSYAVHENNNKISTKVSGIFVKLESLSR